jgi:hypothetical protein
MNPEVTMLLEKRHWRRKREHLLMIHCEVSNSGEIIVHARALPSTRGTPLDTTTSTIASYAT